MNKSEYIFAIDIIIEEFKLTNPILISEKIAEELVNECRTRWEKINDYKRRVSELRLKDNKKHSNIDSNLSIDDISCIICFFGN